MAGIESVELDEEKKASVLTVKKDSFNIDSFIDGLKALGESNSHIKDFGFDMPSADDLKSMVMDNIKNVVHTSVEKSGSFSLNLPSVDWGWGGCEKGVREALSGLEGIASVELDTEKKCGNFEIDKDSFQLDTFITKLGELAETDHQIQGFGVN